MPLVKILQCTIITEFNDANYIKHIRWYENMIGQIVDVENIVYRDNTTPTMIDIYSKKYILKDYDLLCVNNPELKNVSKLKYEHKFIKYGDVKILTELDFRKEKIKQLLR